MSSDFSIPPNSPTAISSGPALAERLKSLIGVKFNISFAAKTDGANLRKLVCATLDKFPLPSPAGFESYAVIPPKAKGVTKIRREWIDTFLVTTGSSYNLQVWNRNPSEPMPQIEYEDGSKLKANDIRFILVKVDTAKEEIRTIVVMTPDYITKIFGKFGIPTVKEQLIISEKKRHEILKGKPPILFYPDEFTTLSDPHKISMQGCSIRNEPELSKLLPLSKIHNFVERNLIGRKIGTASTKNRGQALELIVSEGLGYAVGKQDLLVGGYPDIRHQGLEVKVQDSPTVDLGRYSPQFEEQVPGCPGFTTRSIRYLIALMDPVSSTCIGAILCPGSKLGRHFTYVPEKSFKCQRSIPMDFFTRLDGKSVYNPSLH